MTDSGSSKTPTTETKITVQEVSRVLEVGQLLRSSLTPKEHDQLAEVMFHISSRFLDLSEAYAIFSEYVSFLTLDDAPTLKENGDSSLEE